MSKGYKREIPNGTPVLGQTDNHRPSAPTYAIATGEDDSRGTVALGAAASAQAAAPWSAPVRIGPAGAEVISVGFGSTGRGLVAL